MAENELIIQSPQHEKQDLCENLQAALKVNGIQNPDINHIPMPVMAYIGDSVFEVYARLHSVRTESLNVKQLHQASVRMVKADSQANILQQLSPYLTDLEKDVVRRGRNAKSGQTPKGVSTVLYRYSSAFETLIGYFYLTGQQKRMEELFQTIGLFSEERE